MVYRKSRRAPTQVATIPMPLRPTSITNCYDNSALDSVTGSAFPASNTQASDDDNVYSDITPAAAVGGSGDIYYDANFMYEPGAVYEFADPQVSPSYESARPNRHRIFNKVRNSLMSR